jgi:uncharacterized protein DUF5681
MPKKRSKSAPKRYEVGYGHPPKQFRFKKGHIGNPKGINRKASASLVPDLKAILERALNAKVKMQRGERDKIVTKAAAGIDHLVNQFAKGDRHARRDLMIMADKLGSDLTAGNGTNLQNAIVEAISAEDEALLEEYVEYRIRERLGGGAQYVPRLPKPEPSSEAVPVNREEKEES